MCATKESNRLATLIGYIAATIFGYTLRELPALIVVEQDFMNPVHSNYETLPSGNFTAYSTLTTAQNHYKPATAGGLPHAVRPSRWTFITAKG